MTFGRIILAGLAFAAIAAAQDVSYNFDHSVDFSKFKTYKWAIIKGGTELNDIMAKQVVAAFQAELKKKGLVEVQTDKADLYIGYQVALKGQQQINAYSSGYGYWGWGGGMSTTTMTSSTITTGSLVLDMYDVPHEQLVWRGTATKTLDVKAKPEKRQKNLAKAAEKLLKKYPPEKK